MKTNGSHPNVIKIMYSALPTDKSGFPNPLGESLGVLAQKMHIHQLYPSENGNLVWLQRQVMNWIDTYLTIDKLKADCCSHNLTQGERVEFSLFQWCSNTFVRLGQHVYFGETLTDLDPGITGAFLELDELAWKMLYQYPDFLSQDIAVPRTRVVTTLTRYFQTPRSERKGQVPWLIHDVG